MTPEEYVAWRDRLRRLWGEDASFISYLSPNGQWDLHRYFQFHRDKNSDQVLAYYASVQADDPEVEAKGLVALAHVQVVLDRINQEGQARSDSVSSPPPTKRRAKGDRRVVVRSVVQPEIDATKIARALIQLARQKAEEGGTVEPADGHILGRCSITVDGSHPDLSSFRRSTKRKPQANRFLRCCQLAVQEVDAKHVSVTTAARELSKAASYPAMMDEPVLKTLVDLVIAVGEASNEKMARKIWQQFSVSVGLVKIPS